MFDAHNQLPKTVFLLGLGGHGLGAIAHYLLDLKVCVRGWDDQPGPTIDALHARGARLVFQIDNDVDLMLVSDAVADTHPLISEARALGVQIFGRAEFLNTLGSFKQSIFVAGSHGKSTTSAMIAHVLSVFDPDTSFVLGAAPRQENARSGQARETATLFVAEACEAFGNLRHYQPDIAVLTAITDDHSDHYGGQEALNAAFNAFLARVPATGRCILNGDDLQPVKQPENVITYGMEAENHWSARALVHDWGGSSFDVTQDGAYLGHVRIAQPGFHMVLNALACIAACDAVQVPFDTIKAALATFPGVEHRWVEHRRGTGPRIIEDFANHPAELAANLATIQSIPRKAGRVVTLFQPQTYSRTIPRATAYAAALQSSDLVYLLGPDLKGETPPAPGTREEIMADIAGPLDTCLLFEDVDSLINAARGHVLPNDIVYVAGAGDIRRAARDLAAPQLDRFDLCQNAGMARGRAEQGGLRQSPGGNVVTSILEFCDKTPDALAVRCGGQSLRYAELGTASANLAARLFAAGVQTGDVVAIGLPMSTDFVCTVVAVLRMGCSCLLLDEALPWPRLNAMLSTSQATVLVTHATSTLRFHEFHVRTLTIEDILTSETTEKPLNHSDAAPSETAFISFTSGTSGKPKGVATRHAALIAMLQEATSQLNLDPKCRVGSVSSVNFDAAQSDMLLALTSGAELVYPRQRRPVIGTDLAAFLSEAQITHILATPTVWRTLSTQPFDHLRVIMTGGEKIEKSEIARLATMAAAFNIYGPAEAAIFATIWPYEAGIGVRIGKPLPHVTVHLVDADLRPVHPGEVGEICLSGGICDGYLCGDEEPLDRFVTLRDECGAVQKVFKTGDFARHCPDGQIEFIGRVDHQIKRNGVRIELEDVEAQIAELIGVRDCIAQMNDSSKAFVAFVAPEAGVSLDIREIKRQVERRLPHPMIPSEFVIVSQIPRTVSGKKDRDAMGRYAAVRGHHDVPYIAPISPTEQALAHIWQQVFEDAVLVGRDHDFAALGGDSLHHMTLTLMIEAHFDVSVPPGYLWEVTTLKRLARQIDSLLAHDDAQAPLVLLDSHLTPEIYQKQLRNIATWQGKRNTESSLIVTVGEHAAKHHLFWCFQGAHELRALAEALGPDVCVHGMRSAHLLVEDVTAQSSAFSAHYFNEIQDIRPTGALLIGGNCQGGLIAHGVAELCLQAGRNVRHLILMEQAHALAYNESIGFIFGADSFLHPENRYDRDTNQFQDMCNQAYPQGYQLDTTQGGHGQFFQPTNVLSLAGCIRAQLRKAGVLHYP